MNARITLDLSAADVAALVDRLDDHLAKYFNLRFALVGGRGSENEMDRRRLACEAVVEVLGISAMNGVLK